MRDTACRAAGQIGNRAHPGPQMSAKDRSADMDGAAPMRRVILGEVDSPLDQHVPIPSHGRGRRLVIGDHVGHDGCRSRSRSSLRARCPGIRLI